MQAEFILVFAGRMEFPAMILVQNGVGLCRQALYFQ